MVAYGGKDESGILAQDYGVFRNHEPWVKDVENNGTDHGNAEYLPSMERLVTRFREWRSKLDLFQ
jgi:hypothetical protein